MKMQDVTTQLVALHAPVILVIQAMEVNAMVIINVICIINLNMK